VPEFEPELVVAGAPAPPDDPPQAGLDPGDSRAIIDLRLEDDYQLRMAYQTARRWLGSK
jgi:hypothetical protein